MTVSAEPWCSVHRQPHGVDGTGMVLLCTSEGSRRRIMLGRRGRWWWWSEGSLFRPRGKDHIRPGLEPPPSSQSCILSFHTLSIIYSQRTVEASWRVARRARQVQSSQSQSSVQKKKAAVDIKIRSMDDGATEKKGTMRRTRSQNSPRRGFGSRAGKPFPPAALLDICHCLAVPEGLS